MDVLNWPRASGLAVQAGYFATVPVFGRVKNDRNSRELVKRVHSRWQRRVKALVAAGWDIAEGSQQLALYCPPNGFMVRRLRACRTAACPFCHGRKVEKLYRQVVRATMGWAINHQVVGYVRQYGFHPDSGNLIKTSGGKLTADFEDVVTRQRAVALKFANPPWSGGCIWIQQFEPVVTNFFQDADGFWRVTHRAVYITPKNRCPAQKEFKYPVRIADGSDPAAVADVIGWALKYPKRWFECDAILHAELLNNMYKRHLTSRYGGLRK
jgi:hypothetical protein